MYVCIYMFIFMSIYIHICVCVCIYIYIYRCMYIYMYRCMYIYIYKCMHIYIYIYRCVYIYIYTEMYVCDDLTEFESPFNCTIYIYIYKYVYYRTLHSYKLFWAVCHLFPQRWRTLTYSVLGNHWPGGPRDMFKTRSARKFKSCVFEPPTRRVFSINTSSSNTLVLFDQISPQQQHTPFSVNTGEKSNTMDGPCRHSYTMTMRHFPVSEKLPVSNHKKRTF